VIREAIDRVAEHYAAGTFQNEAVRARAEYRDLTGRVLADGVEGDDLERELQTFLEWYVIERPLQGEIPVLRFLRAEARALPPEERGIFRGLAWSHRGVFELVDLPEGEVHLCDLVRGGLWRVYERREMVGIRRGDVIEARLVPYQERLLFSESFLVHPHAARHAIPALIARLRRRELSDEAILLELGRRWLRAQHYRNVALERLYLEE
jgi:hypothetical protein